MPITAPIICRQPAEFVPTITATAAQVASGTASPLTVQDIAFSVITANTGALAYDLSQAFSQFLPDWVLSSETPAICTVVGNRVTKVSSGIGIIRASGPHGFSKSIAVDFSLSSAVSTIWTGFTGVTKSSQLSDPILLLLAPAKQRNIFSTYPTVRNPNCWAAPMDLTGSPTATSFGGTYGTANSGALITPQHWVGVSHWGSQIENMGPGATISCVGSEGIVHTRTVVQRYVHPGKDLIVSRLDAPFPATVRPFKLAGSTMIDTPNQRFLGMGWQITQEKNIAVVGFDKFTVNNLQASLHQPPYIQWDYRFPGIDHPAHRMNGLQGLMQIGRTGDSGGAIGGYYNGETYLVSLFTGPFVGVLYSEAQAAELNAIIASLDAAQGTATGYQVGVLNVASSFTPLSLAPLMWLDASDAGTLYDATTGGALVAADGAIARWEDKSGNARHATQSTLAARPLKKSGLLNGLPVVRFNGGDDSLIHALSVATDNTVFMVVKSNEVGNAVKSLYGATGPSVGMRSDIFAERNSGGIWATYRLNGDKLSGQSVRGSYKVISLNSTGTDGTFSTNGSISSFAGGGLYSDGLDRRFVGGATPANGENCACDIAEILVFPLLSAGDRLAVEGYLRTKWAAY